MTMSEDVLSTTAPNEDQSEGATEVRALEALVGEGKKFSDVDKLAEGKLAGDRHIETLEAELADLRANLEKRMTAEEILSEIKNSQKDSADEGNQSHVEGNQSRGDIELNDIVSLVDQRMNEKSVKEVADSNRAKVNKQLVEKLGDVDTAKKFVDSKAVELGLAPESLVAMAEQSPDAFMKLVDVPQAPRGSNDIDSTHSTQGLLSGGTDNLKPKYDELRRTNPELYYSSKTQNEIMKAGLEGKYY
jgi:hypothetical protein